MIRRFRRKTFVEFIESGKEARDSILELALCQRIETIENTDFEDAPRSWGSDVEWINFARHVRTLVREGGITNERTNEGREGKLAKENKKARESAKGMDKGMGRGRGERVICKPGLRFSRSALYLAYCCAAFSRGRVPQPLTLSFTHFPFTICPLCIRVSTSPPRRSKPEIALVRARP